MSSIKSQVATRYQVKVEDLAAVVYYADRSWTRAVFFGTSRKKFETYIKRNHQQNQSFQTFGWKDLKTVPEQAFIEPASAFGIEGEGKKVLLVSGLPPDS